MKKRLLITIFTAIALVFALNKSFAQCDFTVTDDEPYFDDFEASENFVCWQTEIVSGIDDWVIEPGYLILNNTAFFIWMGGEAMLISTPLDLTAVSYPTLTFNHKQMVGLSYGTGNWETVTVALPNPSATYQIVFNGIGHDGEGASPLTFSTFNHII